MEKSSSRERKASAEHKNCLVECIEQDILLEISFVRSPISCLNVSTKYPSCCCRKTVCTCPWICFFETFSYSIFVIVLCSFMQVQLSQCCSSLSFLLHFPFISPLLHLISSRHSLSHTQTVKFLRYFWHFLPILLLLSPCGVQYKFENHKKWKMKNKSIFYSGIFIINNTTKRKKLKSYWIIVDIFYIFYFSDVSIKNWH